VIVRPETLAEVDRFFRDHPERSVMIGVYSPEPANEGTWPLYKALQCYSYYWRFPMVREVTLLWSAVAAFRRGLFLQSGGFSARFDRPSMEDLELGRRIAPADPIVLNRRVVVRHHFPSTLRRNVRDHFHRGYLWVKIYFRHHKFDDYLSTPRRALGRLSAFAVLPALAVAPFESRALLGAAAYFFVYLACNWDLWAVVARRSPLFLPAALGIDLLLGWVLGAAALSAVADEAVRILRRAFRRPSRTLAAASPPDREKS